MSDTSAIKVLLVDDERLVCAHLRTILTRGGVEVVGEAHDGAEAIEAVIRLSPDVVLMDIRMPSVDGLTATEKICAMPVPPKVLMLTTFDLNELMDQTVRLLGDRFINKLEIHVEAEPHQQARNPCRS